MTMVTTLRPWSIREVPGGWAAGDTVNPNLRPEFNPAPAASVHPTLAAAIAAAPEGRIPVVYPQTVAGHVVAVEARADLTDADQR
jgi:hypothetical protein